ncbi:hypothetical protein ACLESD_22105 [Pyxidicoccus sp. 3LFB2]
MRATWFRLACWAVLALSPVPAVATAETAVPEKKDTKLIAGDALTREEFKQLRGFLGMRRAMLQQSSTVSRQNPVPAGQEVPWEVLPTHWPLPPPGVATAREVRAALQEARTFYVDDFMKELRVAGGLPSPVARANFEVSLQVTALRDAKRRKVPFQPVPEDALSIINEGGFAPTRLELNVKPVEGQAFPDDLEGWTGQGVAKLRIPTRYQVLSFTEADVGTTREGITLKAWGRGRVELEDARGRLLKGGVRPGRRHPDSVELVGLSADGHRLGEGQNAVDEPARFEFLEKLLQLPWEEVPAVVPAPADLHRRVVHQVFEGTLARLDVYVPTRVETHTLALRLVHKTNKLAAHVRQPPVDAPRRTLCEVSTASLAKEVRVFGSRLDSSSFRSEFPRDQHGKPSVAAKLPVCDNTWFSDVTLRELKYLDAAGNPVSAEPVSEKGRRRRYSFGHEFFFRKPGEEESAQKDATFRELARIEGVARIVVPRLRVLSLTRRKPRAEGVELLTEGDIVRLKLPAALHARLAQAEDGVDRLDAVTAYDAKGRLLAKGYAEKPISMGDTVEVSHRLFGKWERIDLLLVEEQVQLEQPFAVTLPPAPELPPAEEKAKKD